MSNEFDKTNVIVTTKIYEAHIFLMVIAILAIMFWGLHTSDMHSIYSMLFLLFSAVAYLFFHANFVDISIENNSLINIYYWGSPTSYSVIKKIGIIPATDRFGGFILNACYIVYINAVGKKRIKFFYVTGKNGFLIEELKNIISMKS